MKFAICDDDIQYRDVLREAVGEYVVRREDINISFTVFSCAEDLLESAARIGGFDVYLLDISMPGINGIDLGVQLRKSGYDGRIIYLSASSEYAVDSFRAKPFNYLLKPVEKETLFAALDEAAASVASVKEKSVIVRTREGSVRVNFDSILWAELSRRVIVYHLTGGKTVESVQIRTTFSEAVQEFLSDDRFILCGASIMANLHHITLVEKDSLVFKDTYKVYLPRKACSEVRSAWCDFWFNMGGEVK